MRNVLRCVLSAALAVGLSSTAAAGELTVKIADGRVTVIAQDVPLRQILAEWARVGDTKMVNAEKVVGGPISLQLVDVPEKEALDILLRSAAGYMTAPRPTAVPGSSLYDRVIILATSRPPAGGVPTPAPFNTNRQVLPPPLPVPQPPPDDDDPGDPGDQGPNAPLGAQPPGMPFPGQNPGMPPGAVPPNQGPVTSPRPGLIPQPQPDQPNPANPYSPIGPNGRPIPPPGGRGGGPGGPGMNDR